MDFKFEDNIQTYRLSRFNGMRMEFNIRSLFFNVVSFSLLAFCGEVTLSSGIKSSFQKDISEANKFQITWNRYICFLENPSY